MQPRHYYYSSHGTYRQPPQPSAAVAALTAPSPSQYTGWLRPASPSLLNSREAMLTTREMRELDAWEAERQAQIDSMARGQHHRRVERGFDRWRREMFAWARLGAITAEVRERVDAKQRRRFLATAWKSWQARRHLLYFRTRHDRWLAHLLSTPKMMRAFAWPYLVRSWQAWRTRAHVSSRLPLRRVMHRRGFTAFREERAERRRVSRKLAVVASLQFAMVQSMQLQSCCRAWTAWLAWHHSELGTERRRRLREQRAARMAQPVRAFAFARWRSWRVRVLRALERREYDREATCGCGVLRREMAAVERGATVAIDEARWLRTQMGFLKREYGILEEEFETASATAAREARRAEAATRRAEAEAARAAVAIQRAEVEAEKAAVAAAAVAAAAAGGSFSDRIDAGGASFSFRRPQGGDSTFEGFALREAASENSPEMVNQQLDRSPGCLEEADPETGMTALLIACECGSAAAARALAGRGANLEHRSHGGWTALALACSGGHEQVVSALLSHGANVDTAVEDGLTPLMITAEHGHVEIMRSLLGKDADVNVVAEDGSTALMLAAEHGHTGVVRGLIGANADANKKLPDGSTALKLASENDHGALAALLSQVTEMRPPSANARPPPPLARQGRTSLDPTKAMPDLMQALMQTNAAASPLAMAPKPAELAPQDAASSPEPRVVAAPASSLPAELASAVASANAAATPVATLTAPVAAPPWDERTTPSPQPAGSLRAFAASLGGGAGGSAAGADDDEAPTGPAVYHESQSSAAGGAPDAHLPDAHLQASPPPDALLRRGNNPQRWLPKFGTTAASASPTSLTGRASPPNPSPSSTGGGGGGGSSGTISTIASLATSSFRWRGRSSSSTAGR